MLDGQDWAMSVVHDFLGHAADEHMG